MKPIRDKALIENAVIWLGAAFFSPGSGISGCWTALTAHIVGLEWTLSRFGWGFGRY